MRISLCALVAIMATVCNAAGADELGTPIDLSSFSGMDSVRDESANTFDADTTPIVPVDSSGYAPWIRPYVTGIVGASFGTINAGGSTPWANGPGGYVNQGGGSFSEAMFTGGGAIGMAIDRPSGLLRMEVEGRARGPMSGQTKFFSTYNDGQPNIPESPLTTTATNGWSAMVNFWRDYFFTDRLGVYGGGGFGVGGYQYAFQGPLLGIPDPDAIYAGSSTVNTFAWQVGTGITYRLNDRVTFDTGYRFFAMTPSSTMIRADFPKTSGPDLIFGSVTSAFSASELLVSVRIYEPFRNWR
jgi:opacity protein-like surface antigen